MALEIEREPPEFVVKTRCETGHTGTKRRKSSKEERVYTKEKMRTLTVHYKAKNESQFKMEWRKAVKNEDTNRLTYYLQERNGHK